MGVFNKIFGGSASEDSSGKASFNWLKLEDVNQLNDIVEKSNSKTQVIFKHSTRCGISKMAIKQLEQDFASLSNDIDFYYLDLLNYRPISLEIANKFNVEHQSPQVVVVKNEEVVKFASHGDINAIDFNALL